MPAVWLPGESRRWDPVYTLAKFGKLDGQEPPALPKVVTAYSALGLLRSQMGFNGTATTGSAACLVFRLLCCKSAKPTKPLSTVSGDQA